MPKNIKITKKITDLDKDLANLITNILEEKNIFSELAKDSLTITLPSPKNPTPDQKTTIKKDTFNVKYLKNDNQLSNISFICTKKSPLLTPTRTTDHEILTQEYEISHLNFEEKTNLESLKTFLEELKAIQVANMV